MCVNLSSNIINEACVCFPPFLLRLFFLIGWHESWSNGSLWCDEELAVHKMKVVASSYYPCLFSFFFSSFSSPPLSLPLSLSLFLSQSVVRGLLQGRASRHPWYKHWPMCVLFSCLLCCVLFLSALCLSFVCKGLSNTRIAEECYGYGF